MIPLTIWMNLPSFYQVDLYRDLVKTGAVELEVIFAHELSSHRASMGWRSPLENVNFPYRVLDESGSMVTAARIAGARTHRVHIVNGIWAEPSFASALGILTAAGSKCLIYSEAPNPFSAPRPLRTQIKRLYGSWIARRGGVLGIASFARNFYRSIGFPGTHIYEFGYFETAAEIGPQPARADVIECVFVGQLIHRKGVDLLLTAFAPLVQQEPRLRLTLIGDGEARSELEAQAEQLGIRSALRFEGIMPSDQIRQRIAQAHLLLVPSRYDGWGIVANEALSVGVPVVISDMCGAAELIRPGENGYVFPSEDTDALAACLASYLSDPLQWSKMRQSAFQIGKLISSEVAAHHLVECIRHFTGTLQTKPTAPWLKGLKTR